MRWLLVRTLALIVLLTIVTSVAVLIGRAQPPPSNIAFLHLDECQLPCWIGIVPGITTFAEAKQRISQVYSQEQNTLVKIVSVDIVRVSNELSSYHTQVHFYGYVGEQTENSIVREIIVSQYDSAEAPESNLNISLGDLFFALGGNPSDVILSAGLYTSAPVVMFNSQRVHVFVAPSRCVEISEKQTVLFFVLYQEMATDSAWDSQPERWRGVGKCYFPNF